MRVLSVSGKDLVPKKRGALRTVTSDKVVDERVESIGDSTIKAKIEVIRHIMPQNNAYLDLIQIKID